jgi:hypothetical protein
MLDIMHNGDSRLHASAAATPCKANRLSPAISQVSSSYICLLLLLCVLQYLGAYGSEEAAHQALQARVWAHSWLQTNTSSLQQ